MSQYKGMRRVFRDLKLEFRKISLREVIIFIKEKILRVLRRFSVF